MQTINPKKLYVVFGMFLFLGLFISIFVAFWQISISPYIVMAFGVLVAYFGAKGIYKTRQLQLKERQKSE